MDPTKDEPVALLPVKAPDPGLAFFAAQQTPAFAAQAQMDLVDVADVQSAYDEVFRELAVRKRCFPRWVTEGRLSMTDAADRLARQERALRLLRLLLATRGVVFAEMPQGMAVVT